MLAPVCTSVSPTSTGAAKALLQAVGQRQRLVGAAADGARRGSPKSSPSSRASTSSGRIRAWMRRATVIRNWSPTPRPRLSLSCLKRSKLQVQHRELARRVAAVVVDRLRHALVQAAAVGQIGQHVVIGEVLQAVLRRGGAPSRRRPGRSGATRSFTVLCEVAAMHRGPDLVAQRMHGSAARSWKLGVCARCAAAASGARAPARRARRSARGSRADERRRVRGPSSAAQVGLTCTSWPSSRNQRHADGRMREGALKAPVAHVRAPADAAPPSAASRSAFSARSRLARSAALALDGFLLREVAAQGGHEQADHRHRHEHRGRAELAERQVEHAGDRGAGDSSPCRASRRW